MSNIEIIFRNIKEIINRGKDISPGLMYCGKKYASNKGYPFLNCDGYYSLENGYPCPEYYYTLSYILHSTGEMVCPYCKYMLLRLNIFNIRLLRRLLNNSSITYNLCNCAYYQVFISMMHCRKCIYILYNLFL